MSDKKYLCGICGKLDQHETENGYCGCGADMWVEIEDFFNDELISYVNKAKENTGMNQEEMLFLLSTE